MKQTQNQFYGKRRDLPSKLPPGSIYICSDEDSFYHAREDGRPIPFEINQESIDALRVGKKLIGWQDYADSNTSEANPIVQSNVNGGEVQLTNNNNDTATDGSTNINSNTTLEGVNDLWDTTTNTFIFKDTGIGKNDLFDIRFNPNVSPNIVSQDFGIRVDFYDDVAGTGNKIFSLKKSGKTRNDSAGVFDDDFIHIKGYFGESILNGSAIAYFYGSKSFELEYIGHMINLFKISR